MKKNTFTPVFLACFMVKTLSLYSKYLLKKNLQPKEVCLVAKKNRTHT